MKYRFEVVPKFYGDKGDMEAWGWLIQLDQFFQKEGIKEDQKFVEAVGGLRGNALDWYRGWKWSNLNASWRNFEKAFIHKYIPDLILVDEAGEEKSEAEAENEEIAKAETEEDEEADAVVEEDAEKKNVEEEETLADTENEGAAKEEKEKEDARADEVTEKEETKIEVEKEEEKNEGERDEEVKDRRWQNPCFCYDAPSLPDRGCQNQQLRAMVVGKLELEEGEEEEVEEEEDEEDAEEEGAEKKKKQQPEDEQQQPEDEQQQREAVEKKEKRRRGAEMVKQGLEPFCDLMGQAQTKYVLDKIKMGSTQSFKITLEVIVDQSPRPIVNKCNVNMLKIVNIENTVTCYRQWDPGGGILVSPFTLRTR